MKHWRNVTYSDVCNIIREPCAIEKSTNEKYIGLEHIEQNGLRLTGVGHSSDVSSNKFRFQINDVLYGKLRPYFRKVVMAKFDGICSTDIWVIRNTELTDPCFLFYLIASPYFTKLATISSEGTRMPRASWNFLSRQELRIPPMDEQRTIAYILGTLDEKIELNRQMNETLEEMARALFKSWFIDFDPVHAKAEGRQPYGMDEETAALFPDEFEDSELGEIPKGWFIQDFESLISISSGKRPIMIERKESPLCSIPVFGGGGIMGYTANSLYNEPIIATGRVGTIGKIFRINGPSWPSDNTIVIKPLVEEDYGFLYHVLQNLDLNSIKRGSTQPLVTQTDIKNTKAIVPPLRIRLQYHGFVNTLFKRILINSQNSETLLCILDDLIPKLISGELKIYSKMTTEE